MTEVITELLRKGLMSEGTGTPASRVRLPLVRNTRMATTEDFSPDRISAILQASEVAELASREE